MTLGLTQLLKEMSSWGVKVAGTQDRQSYHLHVLIVMKSGSLNLLESSGPVQTSNGTALTFYKLHKNLFGPVKFERILFPIHTGTVSFNEKFPLFFFCVTSTKIAKCSIFFCKTAQNHT
jgi:hypothetical protein